MPKIIDQTEISSASRALNQHHLSKRWKYSKISRNIYDYFHFIDMLKARGVAEISDRSTIFGLWCHMSVHMQLYAYMTLIFENMTKNRKTKDKFMCIFMIIFYLFWRVFPHLWCATCVHILRMCLLEYDTLTSSIFLYYEKWRIFRT